MNKLFCKIGWHSWRTTEIDVEARPPLKHLACKHCPKTATTFYDNSATNLLKHLERNPDVPPV